jgi:O-antigen/teichoic acid export membrane protein
VESGSEALETREADVLDSTAAGSRAIRGSAWRVIGYFAGTLLAVVSSAFLYRHLGRSNTGHYNVAINLVAIVAGLSDLGLTAIGVRELAVLRGGARDRMARSLLGLRVVTTLSGLAVVEAFAIGVGYGTTLEVGVALAGAGLLLQTCQSTLTISLLVDLRPAWVAVFDVLRNILTSVLIVALVLIGARLLGFLAVTIPVGMVVLALNVRVVRGRVPLRPAFHAAEWWRILRGALPYTFATAASALYAQAAVIVVSLVVSAGALGDFSLSVRAIQLLLVLPGLAIGVALPIFARAARDDRARLAYALERTFEVSLLLGALVALAVAVGAPMATTVYGPKFSHAVPLVAIQGAGLGASFVGAAWANGLLGLGRYKAILAINLLALFVGTTLITLLTLADGVHGAAIATSAWEGVVVVLSGIALVRHERRLMPPFSILPKVAAALGLGVLTTLITLPALPAMLVAAAVYVVTVVVLRAVPDEVYDEVRRLRRALV